MSTTTCPCCLATITLTAKGTLRSHGRHARTLGPCMGAYRTPEEAAVLAAIRTGLSALGWWAYRVGQPLPVYTCAPPPVYTVRWEPPAYIDLGGGRMMSWEAYMSS